MNLSTTEAAAFAFDLDAACLIMGLDAEDEARERHEEEMKHNRRR